MICSKEVRKDKESRKINIKVGKTHNVRIKKRAKWYRNSQYQVQTKKHEGLTWIMSKMVSKQSAPDIHTDVFDRNLLEFKCFKWIFEKTMENRVTEPRSRLTQLIKYNKRYVKKSVSHSIQQPNKLCHDNAKGPVMK